MLKYQPQSPDTNPEIDKFLMQAFRQMPVWKKAHLTNQATKGIQQWAILVFASSNGLRCLSDIASIFLHHIDWEQGCMVACMLGSFAAVARDRNI